MRRTRVAFLPQRNEPKDNGFAQIVARKGKLVCHVEQREFEKGKNGNGQRKSRNPAAGTARHSPKPLVRVVTPAGLMNLREAWWSASGDAALPAFTEQLARGP